MSLRSEPLTLVPPRQSAPGSKKSSPNHSSAILSDPSRLPLGPYFQAPSEFHYVLPTMMDQGHQGEDLPWTGDASHRFTVDENASFDTLTMDSFPTGDAYMMPAMALGCYDATAPAYPMLNPAAMSQTLAGPYQETMFEQDTMQASPISMAYPGYQHFPQATIKHGLPSPPAECFNGIPDDLTMDPVCDPVCDVTFSTLPGPSMDNSVLFDSPIPTSITKIGQPRPIRSASERSISNQRTMASQDIQYLQDERGDKVKARNDPRYDQKPDDQGLYHCPMVTADGCNHRPTKQKCIFAKYLDSHLKPYICKHGSTANECENLRFSSNACLFRHEREAHGMHNHGINPYLCLYPGCERSRSDSGFPRRWNQRDHMKRVHDWVDAEAEDKHAEKYGPTESTKRRKQSGSLNGVSMKRSTSSQAKAQAAVYNHGIPRNVSIPRYQAQINKQLHECNMAGFPTLETSMQYPSYQPQLQHFQMSTRTPSAYTDPYNQPTY